ncbi:hypothetical protein VPH35_130541 [Triticum aestivum]
MASRWTRARKHWSPSIAKNCYPIYHQQYEALNESVVTWNPWTQEHVQMVFNIRPITPGMLTDSAIWLTHCYLLFMWCVEPYNPERVMRQFGLYQEIPPPFLRCTDEETHKLSNMGHGWSLYDWRERNIQWVQKWENDVLADIVYQLRPYDGSTTQAYKQWYCISTRTSLAGQPATIPTNLTHEEQMQRPVKLHAAYFHDRVLQTAHDIGQMATESMPPRAVKSFNKRVKEYIATKLRCGRGDNVVTGAYNMPVPRSARPSAAPSSRPSEARTSHGQRGEGPSTTTTLPRYDSSLPLHGSSSVLLHQGQTSQDHGMGLDSMPELYLSPNPYAYTGYGTYTQGEGSQPYLSTRGISMPEETRVPDLNQYQVECPDSTGEGSDQGIPDINWNDEYTQPGDNVYAVDTDFFREDVIGPSFIPEESQQPYAYNYASGSQQGLQTPPPMQESQTQEDQLEYGHDLRVPRPPNRLELSGPKGRPAGRRRLQ